MTPFLVCYLKSIPVKLKTGVTVRHNFSQKVHFVAEARLLFLLKTAELIYQGFILGNGDDFMTRVLN